MEIPIDEQLGLKTNQFGRKFQPGIGDPIKWSEVYEELKLGKGPKEISESLKVSPSFVVKVKKSSAKGLIGPKQSGRPKKSTKWDDDEKKVLQILVDKYYFGSLESIRSMMLSTCPGISKVGLSTISRYMNELKLVKKLPKYQHPQKFATLEKIKYYERYVHWLSDLDDDQIIKLKFFDEAQIAKTDQGKWSIWTSQTMHLLPKLKKSEKSEAYTIIGMTQLGSEYPW